MLADMWEIVVSGGKSYDLLDAVLIRREPLLTVAIGLRNNWERVRVCPSFLNYKIS